MIQRIQTIWLLLAVLSLIAALLLTAHMPWLMALLVVAAVIDIVAVFVYKNRKRQIHLCHLSDFLLIAWALVYVIGMLTGKGLEFSVWTLLPVAGLVFQVLAIRGIRHDDELVRSADRIR